MAVQVVHGLLLQLGWVYGLLLQPGWVSGVLGEAVLGTHGYTEYIAGDVGSRLILSVPHGGAVIPNNIPTREDGCWDGSTCNWNHGCGSTDSSHCDAVIIKDLYTKEIAEYLVIALTDLLGHKPHLVICHLHRRKVDVNREIGEGAQGEPTPTTVWQEYHGFLSQAKASLTGPGLLLDLHGQAHFEGWVELGYLLSGNQLDNDALDATVSSIRNLSRSVQGVSFEELLRGNVSLGYYLQQNGYTSVPSPDNPGPNGGSYFSGGYITKQYGSRDGGTLDAIQVEMPSEVRNTVGAPGFVYALSVSVEAFMRHYGDSVEEGEDSTDSPESTESPESGSSATPDQDGPTTEEEGGEEETISQTTTSPDNKTSRLRFTWSLTLACWLITLLLML